MFCIQSSDINWLWRHHQILYVCLPLQDCTHVAKHHWNMWPTHPLSRPNQEKMKKKSSAVYFFWSCHLTQSTVDHNYGNFYVMANNNKQTLKCSTRMFSCIFPTEPVSCYLASPSLAEKSVANSLLILSRIRSARMEN